MIGFAGKPRMVWFLFYSARTSFILSWLPHLLHFDVLVGIHSSPQHLHFFIELKSWFVTSHQSSPSYFISCCLPTVHLPRSSYLRSSPTKIPPIDSHAGPIDQSSLRQHLCPPRGENRLTIQLTGNLDRQDGPISLPAPFPTGLMPSTTRAGRH